MQMTSSRAHLGRDILVVMVVLAVAAWLMAFELSQPLSLDHGIFVWGGHVLSHGGIMYRDTWDHKGPLPYYFAAWVETLFGRTEWGLRAFDMAWQGGVCALVYGILRKLGTRTPAAVAAMLVYVAWYVALDYANSDQPDGWAGVLVTLCVFLLVAKPRSAVTPWLCGAIIGICCLIKITFGMFLMLPALYVLPLQEPRRSIAFLAKIGVGWLVPMALSVAFFAAHGILQDYYDASIGYNLVYANTQAFSWPMRLWWTFKMLLLSIRLCIPSLLTAYGVARLIGREWRSGWLIATWIVATFVHVLIQGKIVWLYHWLPVYPALAVGVGLGVDAVLTQWTKYRTRHAGHCVADVPFVTVGVVAVLTIGMPAVRHLGGWTIHELHNSANDGYDDRLYGMWGHGPHSVAAASRYIARRTTPDQFVLFGSSWVLGNYLSDRWNPTRLTEARPYMDTPVSPYTRQFLAEFLHGITIHPPAYIVEGSAALCKADPYEARYCVQHSTEMQALLARCYRRDQELGDLDIWRRTCGDAGAVTRPAPDMQQ